MLNEAGYTFDVAHTSRAQARASARCGSCWTAWTSCGCPVHNTWRLNERHYGALQGLNKAETAAKYGDEQVHIWRRSFDVPPPPLTPEDERYPGRDPRYAALTPGRPAADGVASRTRSPASCRTGRARSCHRSTPASACIIAAHGNSLRALVKHLDRVSEADIRRAQHPDRHPAGLRAGPGHPAAAAPLSTSGDAEAAKKARGRGGAAGKAQVRRPRTSGRIATGRGTGRRAPVPSSRPARIPASVGSRLDVGHDADALQPAAVLEAHGLAGELTTIPPGSTVARHGPVGAARPAPDDRRAQRGLAAARRRARQRSACSRRPAPPPAPRNRGPALSSRPQRLPSERRSRWCRRSACCRREEPRAATRDAPCAAPGRAGRRPGIRACRGSRRAPGEIVSKASATSFGVEPLQVHGRSPRRAARRRACSSPGCGSRPFQRARDRDAADRPVRRRAPDLGRPALGSHQELDVDLVLQPPRRVDAGRYRARRAPRRAPPRRRPRARRRRRPAPPAASAGATSVTTVSPSTRSTRTSGRCVPKTSSSTWRGQRHVARSWRRVASSETVSAYSVASFAAIIRGMKSRSVSSHGRSISAL